MKAITRTQYGSPSVLQIKDIPIPKPQANELQIRVHATTVNRTDCGILRGKPYLIRAFVGILRPSDLVPGTDFAGEITAIGKAVTDFKIGDRVWGLDDEGLASQAEYMTIRADRAVATIPTNFSYTEAVACAEGVHYAYNFINKVELKTGSKVLVNGATGAIGSAAVQLLKARGIYVTAVANTKNIALVRSLGADKLYNYETEDFTTDTDRYHFIFDAVGKSSFGKCKHLLLPKGGYISSELGPNAENLYLPLITKIRGDKRVIFPIPSDCRRSILMVKERMETGQFQAVIDRTYLPEEIREAYTYVESGMKTGNVVINFSDNFTADEVQL